MVSRKALSQRGTPENILRRDIGMTRQICARLELDQCVWGKQLIKGCECFERCGAASEAAVPVAGRQDHAAKQAQNRSAAQTGPHFTLESERRISYASVPGLVLVLELHRDVHLDLV